MTDELPPDPNHPRQVACCAYATTYQRMCTTASTHIKAVYPADVTHPEEPELAEFFAHEPTTQLLHYGWGIITFASEQVGGMRLTYFIDGLGAHVYGRPIIDGQQGLKTGDARPSEHVQYAYCFDLTHHQALTIYDTLNPDSLCTLRQYLDREVDAMVAAAPLTLGED